MRPIIAIIGVVLAGSIFFWYTKPEYDKVQTARDKIAQYDAALNKAYELQQLKQTLLSRFNAFSQADRDRLQKLLPDHVDNVRLILDLDNLAEDRGIALQNVDVSSSQKQTTKSPTVIGAAAGSTQKYDSLTLTFGTVSTYPGFVQFLTDLESSLRIVDLVALSISPSGNIPSAPSGATNPFSTSGAKAAAPGKSTEPLYAFKITLRTYWLK